VHQSQDDETKVVQFCSKIRNSGNELRLQSVNKKCFSDIGLGRISDDGVMAKKELFLCQSPTFKVCPFEMDIGGIESLKAELTVHTVNGPSSRPSVIVMVSGCVLDEIITSGRAPLFGGPTRVSLAFQVSFHIFRWHLVLFFWKLASFLESADFMIAFDESAHPESIDFHIVFAHEINRILNSYRPLLCLP
jgi:hypothetical protein